MFTYATITINKSQIHYYDKHDNAITYKNSLSNIGKKNLPRIVKCLF